MGALLTPRKLALDKGEPKARTDSEDRFERILLACYGKNVVHAGDPMAHRLWATDEYPAGCSKRPSSKAAASEEARCTLRYVEPLSEARTKLADFFSILLSGKERRAC